MNILISVEDAQKLWLRGYDVWFIEGSLKYLAIKKSQFEDYKFLKWFTDEAGSLRLR